MNPEDIDLSGEWDIDRDGKPDIEAEADISKKGIIIKILPESGLGKLVLALIIAAAGYLISHYAGVI